jgi:hypothetical protein
MGKNQPWPPTGLSLFRFNLESAAAQPFEFLTTDGHGWTRIKMSGLTQGEALP